MANGGRSRNSWCSWARLDFWSCSIPRFPGKVELAGELPMPFSRGVITRDRSHLRARTLPCCRRAARSISSVSSSAQPQCAGVVPTASKGGHLDVSRRVLCCRRSFPAAAHAGRLGQRRETGLSGARQAGDGFVPPGAVPLRRQTPLDTGRPWGGGARTRVVVLRPDLPQLVMEWLSPLLRSQSGLFGLRVPSLAVLCG